ncbi:hypothetical protein [Nocardia vaccinii]|uniref:hypothetical protein n=1 Tax=Nocardia vaccinii TaxID=1822 RepID=UPI0008297804|nr:hypothetical protein [Nocardia vaccinii]
MAGGKHRAPNPHRNRVGSVVAASAVPLVLTVVGSGAAAAVPAHSNATAEQDATPAQSPASDISNAQPHLTNDVLSSLRSARPLPDQSYLAPVGALHVPTAVAPVAPIAPSPGELRFDDVQLEAPTWIDRGHKVAVNDGAAEAEAGVATFLDSVGMERSRSDRIASAAIGTAAIGAVAGATASAPLAATSGVVGGVAELVAGVPLLPIGLIAGPALGAAIGLGVITVPAAAMGAAAGAAQGFTAPPHAVAG